jgi:hypothetical protein
VRGALLPHGRRRHRQELPDGRIGAAALARSGASRSGRGRCIYGSRRRSGCSALVAQLGAPTEPEPRARTVLRCRMRRALRMRESTRTWLLLGITLDPRRLARCGLA